MNSREKLLLSVILLYIIGWNIIAITIASREPLVGYPPIRPDSPMGTIPITGGSGTESLGYIDDSNVSLYWFLHVTDIHLSEYPDDPNVVAYGQWLNWTYDVVHPLSIVVSGDLTGGQHPDNFTGAGFQVQREFHNYYRTVNATGYGTDPNLFRYLEVAGNHDRNSDWGGSNILNFTMMGRRFGSLQAFYTATFSSGKAAFALLDATPLQSPPIFFGSEGSMDSNDLGEFETFLEANIDADQIFAFHHQHPLECFGVQIRPGKGFGNSLTGLYHRYKVDAAFYGHSHMEFYETDQDTVYWMGDRWHDEYEPDVYGVNAQYYYHIVSVDAGGVSVANVPFTQMPHIAITNPSNPLFLDPADKRIDTRGDGHVRALIFPDPNTLITEVQYNLDGGQWQNMALYPGSQVLYESPRATTAIPDDGQEHTVQVRAMTNTSIERIQTAKVSYKAERKMFFQGILLGLLAGLLGIIAIMNRDNYPLKRADGKRRRLTHEEKVEKRVKKNADRNRPWWLPYLGWAAALAFLFMPYGLFPIWQGNPVAVYALWIAYPGTPVFLIEAPLYCAPVLIIGFPFLYWGTRTYHPNMANFGGFATFATGGLIVYMVFRDFPTLPWWSFPGAIFYCVVGLAIFFGTMKDTFPIRLIKKSLKRKK